MIRMNSKVVKYQVNQFENSTSYRQNKYHVQKVHSFIRKYYSPSIRKVLDVGCNDGAFLSLLMKEFGFIGYGVDVSDKALLKAKVYGIKTYLHDVEKGLPFSNNSFDLIYSCEVIEHLFDTDFFVSENYRVVKPGGFFILTTPNLCSYTNRVLILFNRFPAHGPQYNKGNGHLRAYTLPVLEKQLENCGFSIINKCSSSIPFPMENKYVPKLMKRVAMAFGDLLPASGAHIIVVAKK